MRKVHIENETLLQMLDWVDDRAEFVRTMLEKVTPADLATLWGQLDVSAIYHSSALEGEVLSPEELHTALDPKAVTDASTMGLFASIRNHKKAFVIARRLARAPSLVFSLDLFEQFHRLFAGLSDDAPCSFREDIPLHRAYFHEIHQPQDIAADLANLIRWANDEETRMGLHPIVWAARFHHWFMHIFPYTHTSGKIGRILVAAWLMRHGFLPAVVHATERQRYYEAIRGSAQELAAVFIDAEAASLDSAARFVRRALHVRLADGDW